MIPLKDVKAFIRGAAGPSAYLETGAMLNTQRLCPDCARKRWRGIAGSAIAKTILSRHGSVNDYPIRVAINYSGETTCHGCGVEIPPFKDAYAHMSFVVVRDEAYSFGVWAAPDDLQAAGSFADHVAEMAGADDHTWQDDDEGAHLIGTEGEYIGDLEDTADLALYAEAMGFNDEWAITDNLVNIGDILANARTRPPAKSAPPTDMERRHPKAAPIVVALVDAMLRDGYSLSLWDGYEWVVGSGARRTTRDRAEILNAMAATDTGDWIYGSLPEGRDGELVLQGGIWLIYENDEDVISDVASKASFNAWVDCFQASLA